MSLTQIFEAIGEYTGIFFGYIVKSSYMISEKFSFINPYYLIIGISIFFGWLLHKIIFPATSKPIPILAIIILSLLVLFLFLTSYNTIPLTREIINQTGVLINST